MHKAVILLTKASDREDAIDNVKDFMEQYGNGLVWDWYVIGGRWTQYLAPKQVEFMKKVDEILQGKNDVRSIDEHFEELQKVWEDLGMTGVNACAGWTVWKENENNTYDVLPLAECIDIVKDFAVQDEQRDKEIQMVWNKLLEEKKKYDKTRDNTMVGYYAKKLGKLFYTDEFNWERNVYNISEDVGEIVPEDTTGYYAVMVDMHN